MSDDRYDAMKQIRDDVLALEESPLYEFRQKNNYFPVLGQGSHHAEIFFIGEAPGKNEAETGRPFCGASGRVLDELLESVNLRREDVYVTNVVKDRPPDNRDPHRAEIDLYAPFLDRQIAVIQPSVIATLGRFAMEFVLDRYGNRDDKPKISQIHGNVIPLQMDYGDAHLVPLYHPAVALYNASEKDTLLADFKTLVSFTDD